MIKAYHLGGSRFALACVLLLGLVAMQPAEAFYNSTSPMGTNTNEIMEDDTSVPFIDLMKMSLPFREARPFNKGDMQYDRYGWPTSISAGGQDGYTLCQRLACRDYSEWHLHRQL